MDRYHNIFTMFSIKLATALDMLTPYKQERNKEIAMVNELGFPNANLPFDAIKTFANQFFVDYKTQVGLEDWKSMRKTKGIIQIAANLVHISYSQTKNSDPIKIKLVFLC